MTEYELYYHGDPGGIVEYVGITRAEEAIEAAKAHIDEWYRWVDDISRGRDLPITEGGVEVCRVDKAGIGDSALVTLTTGVEGGGV